jgi:hypothetical protein
MGAPGSRKFLLGSGVVRVCVRVCVCVCVCVCVHVITSQTRRRNYVMGTLVTYVMIRKLCTISSKISRHRSTLKPFLT